MSAHPAEGRRGVPGRRGRGPAKVDTIPPCAARAENSAVNDLSHFGQAGAIRLPCLPRQGLRGNFWVS